jgi:hypothetical protein
MPRGSATGMCGTYFSNKLLIGRDTNLKISIEISQKLKFTLQVFYGTPFNLEPIDFQATRFHF